MASPFSRSDFLSAHIQAKHDDNERKTVKQLKEVEWRGAGSGVGPGAGGEGLAQTLVL